MGPGSQMVYISCIRGPNPGTPYGRKSVRFVHLEPCGKYHIDIRILQSGSKAQDQGFQKPWSVRSTCSRGLSGSCSDLPTRGWVPLEGDPIHPTAGHYEYT